MYELYERNNGPSPFSAASGAPSLDSLGLKHQTDKSSTHHDYLHFYQRFLEPLRALPLNLLEIGVYNGGSANMWAEYFPNARIVGLDIDPSTTRFATDRIAIEIADQSNVDDLVRIAAGYGPFDVILDDGSHMWDHQITSLRWLFPFLKRGGFYIIEDIDTSYGTAVPEFRGVAPEPAAEYLKRIADYLVGDAKLDISREPDAFIRSYARDIEFIAFARRTSITRRRV